MMLMQRWTKLNIGQIVSIQDQCVRENENASYLTLES